MQRASMHLPPEVEALLEALLSEMGAALRENLLGVYLRGSLAMGDFDPDTSDVDFLAVTQRRVSDAEFDALCALHARLALLPNRYASELEGAYIERAAVRRFRPGERFPTIGRGESLTWVSHGAHWTLERWGVRERGVVLLGPEPQTLIDPVSPDELRDAVCARLPSWAEWARNPDDHPDWLLPRSHNAYVVETMCRALHTLATGELQSKPQAVAWALVTLPEPWRATVERSQRWRMDKTSDPQLAPEIRRIVLWTASQCEDSGMGEWADGERM